MRINYDNYDYSETKNDDSCDSTKKEEQAMLLVCLNNAGVKAFERGDLAKSMKHFSRAVHAVLATLNIPQEGTQFMKHGLSKKTTMKVVKSQSKSFQANNTFDVRESRSFGKRKRTNRDCEEEGPLSSTSAITYTYEKVFRIRASNAAPILDQTTPEQLTGIVLLNLAICQHLQNKGGEIQSAQRYYELAFSAARLSGDLLPQVVIWNNLLQLHYEANDVETAFVCKKQLEEKITEIIDRGLLRKLKKSDRQGFLLNVMLFTDQAAAAA